MPSDPTAALGALLKSSSITDHEEILNAANAALKANKTDLIIQHTRVVALLHLDRFDDALRSIEEGGFKLTATCSLEKAYALYKTGSLEDAATVLKSVGLEKRAIKHVAAQVAYRSERFDEASTIYHQLLDNDPADEENDLSINIKAAAAQLEWQGITPSNPSNDRQLDTFDLCYNAACACIGRGALDQATSLLQRAIKLCDASDLSDEEKQSEMRPIYAQQAYVYARLGRLKEALDIYETVGSTDEDENDFQIVAENNRTIIDESPQNPYMRQRHVASWTAKVPRAKLFRGQSNLLQRNSLVTDLSVLKIAGVQARTQKILLGPSHPSTSPNINATSVINTAATTHGSSGKALIRNLVELSQKRPQDVGLALTLIQIQLQQVKIGAALAILASFLARLETSEEPTAQDVRFSPGLSALAVSLMRADGQERSAKNELLKATKYWVDRPASSAASLLREAGVELLRSSNPQDLLLAGSAFEKLFNERRGSHIAAAGLVASLATSSPSKVQQHVAELPTVAGLIGDANIDDLVRGGVVAPSKSTAVKKRAAPSDGADSLAKKRRKRKLPKNYEEGKTPDPERWLALRDRSTYRPKGRKGKKKAQESTQGGVVKEEETLDLVGGGGVKVEKAPQSSNKKKKKGKK